MRSWLPGTRSWLAVVAEQAALIESLRAEVAALRRQAGRDSSNSSQPPSQDGPAAKAKAGQREARRARPGRPQGGQKGHPGASLAWTARPDETLAVEPGTCGGCGADLAGAPGRVASSVQVLDIPPAALTVTEYQMMRRTCGCGQVTTAPPPPGVTGGPVCYGPGVTGAATLLASTDVIGVERAADLMGALFKAPVSTGFVSRCLVRLDAALIAAGFEGALKDALRAADVLGTDETPAPLTTAATSAEGCGNPHVYTVRTMLAWTGGGADLIWYGAAGNRTKAGDHRLRDPGRLPRGPGPRRLRRLPQLRRRARRRPAVPGPPVPVPRRRLRHRPGIPGLDPAGRRRPPRGRRRRQDRPGARQASLQPALLAGLRHSYDQAVAFGISVNLSRPWHKGNHPGLILARRLKRKASQVWLFATRFDVPATNNGSENAVRGYKLAAKISGCWRTLATLQRHCRIRSYLTTARSHGHHPLAAIRDAVSGNCWMPPQPA